MFVHITFFWRKRIGHLVQSKTLMLQYLDNLIHKMSTSVIHISRLMISLPNLYEYSIGFQGKYYVTPGIKHKLQYRQMLTPKEIKMDYRPRQWGTSRKVRQNNHCRCVFGWLKSTVLHVILKILLKSMCKIIRWVDACEYLPTIYMRADSTIFYQEVCPVDIYNRD